MPWVYPSPPSANTVLPSTKREDTNVHIQGRVVGTMPLDKPSRAVIQLRDWPMSIEVPMGDLKYGMNVEVSIEPLKTRGAGAGLILQSLPQQHEL